MKVYANVNNPRRSKQKVVQKFKLGSDNAPGSVQELEMIPGCSFIKSHHNHNINL